ncbi:lysophospholipid acyltransferase family protein [Atopomonas sediminilitoris]|uniref:lysophospholipid acyltransferase family protein n=1 Tax=Atopomonas sediminilitoris TaxID=2919919 RepID=UPI001F4D44CA|nr:lysophospholipid acyltransferase family protein [Atopomonas sediminilitoris]MCJ8169506.1 1-acyl-sn-glycerol-3-phosphate acyltransferase [Atopomonas sediminilitoris]
MALLIQGLRTALFYLLLASSAFVWGSLSLLVGPFLPFPQRFAFIIGVWTRMAMFFARHVVGIEVRIHGREHIPATPCVIMAKHQSTWETFFLQTLFAPQVQVIKRELLSVPFFGWAFALINPIAIDRSASQQALQQLIEQGCANLKDGVWVLIFPEGTRIPNGRVGKFSRGGAALACAAEVPVLPIAHNAATCWPNQTWWKTPGVIDVVIGAPISPNGQDNRAIVELNTRCRDWIVQQQADLGCVYQPHHDLAGARDA